MLVGIGVYGGISVKVGSDVGGTDVGEGMKIVDVGAAVVLTIPSSKAVAVSSTELM